MPVRAPNHFSDEPGKFMDRHVFCKPMRVDPVGTTFCIFNNLRIFWIYTLPSAGETCSLTIEIESIGTCQHSTRRIWPPVSVIASFLQGGSGYIFTSTVVIDDGYSAMGPGKGKVIMLIIFGIRQIYLWGPTVMLKDLFSVDDVETSTENWPPATTQFWPPYDLCVSFPISVISMSFCGWW
jgi:hypothetical protein